ncbi:hypothetical protein COT87_02935, partial [Candidatus Collierbacteria bacterium CG10_big_fil_rev_8_21_14_0_10_44_9]
MLGGIFNGSPTFASTSTYNFTTAGEYSATNNFSVFGGTAHFKLTWPTVGIGFPGTFATSMVSPAENLVWATLNAQNAVYKSTNAGGAWSHVSIDADFTAVDMITVSGDAGGNAVNLVTVGTDAVNPGGVAWSTNNGTNWTYADNLGVGANFVAVAHKSTATSYSWFMNSSGVIQRVTDIDLWSNPSLMVLDGITAGSSMLYIDDKGLVIVGGMVGASGAVFYSADNGTNWTQSVLPGTPTNITQLEYSGGYLYAGGTGYLARADVSGGTPASWTDLSA